MFSRYCTQRYSVSLKKEHSSEKRFGWAKHKLYSCYFTIIRVRRLTGTGQSVYFLPLTLFRTDDRFALSVFLIGQGLRLYRLWTLDFRLWTLDFPLSTFPLTLLRTDDRFALSVFLIGQGLRLYRLWTLDFRLWTLDFPLSTFPSGAPSYVRTCGFYKLSLFTTNSWTLKNNKEKSFLL